MLDNGDCIDIVFVRCGLESMSVDEGLYERNYVSKLVDGFHIENFIYRDKISRC